MRTASPFGPLFATGLLHAALIALAIIGLSKEQINIVPPKPVIVQLLQELKTSPAPLPVAPAPQIPPPQPSPQESPKIQPHTVPKSASQPSKSAPPIDAPAAPFIPAPAAPAPAAVPVAPPAPAAPVPPAPVKTGVSISANYAASNRKPPYPRLSRQNEEQGIVELRVFVKADGTAGEVKVASPSGYPLLDESAKNTVQSWHFIPATVDGKPVGEWYRVPVPFKLQD